MEKFINFITEYIKGNDQRLAIAKILTSSLLNYLVLYFIAYQIDNYVIDSDLIKIYALCLFMSVTLYLHANGIIISRFSNFYIKLIEKIICKIFKFDDFKLTHGTSTTVSLYFGLPILISIFIFCVTILLAINKGWYYILTCILIIGAISTYRKDINITYKVILIISTLFLVYTFYDYRKTGFVNHFIEFYSNHFDNYSENSNVNYNNSYNEYNDGYKKGYDEGYDEGYEKGYEEGYENY